METWEGDVQNGKAMFGREITILPIKHLLLKNIQKR